MVVVSDVVMCVWSGVVLSVSVVGLGLLSLNVTCLLGLSVSLSLDGLTDPLSCGPLRTSLDVSLVFAVAQSGLFEASTLVVMADPTISALVVLASFVNRLCAIAR